MKKYKLPGTVIALGLVSFLNDLASEMVTPFILILIATAFGWYHLAVGLSAIPAGVLFGAIWHYWNAGAAFLFAGGLALLCTLLLHFWSFRSAT